MRIGETNRRERKDPSQTYYGDSGGGTAVKPQQPQTPSPAVTGGTGNRTGGGGGGGGAGYAAPNNQPYINQLNSLYDQIMNRGKFQYDLNGDLLYRQVADQYTQMGRTAMRDATATAAGLTGGYGNSYANQVGNQAYQQYMTQLNSMIPELYDRAYTAWQNQGDDLMTQYQMALAHPGNLATLTPRSGGSSGGAATTPATGVTIPPQVVNTLGSSMVGAANGVSAGFGGVTNPLLLDPTYYEQLLKNANK